MNNKTSPPSVNTSKKCSYLLPYFSSLQGGLVGKQTVFNSKFNGLAAQYCSVRLAGQHGSHDAWLIKVKA
jgi:hypothetical protein